MASWDDGERLDPVPPGHGERAPGVVEKLERCWCGRIMQRVRKRPIDGETYLRCPQHGAKDPRED